MEIQSLKIDQYAKRNLEESRRIQKKIQSAKSVKIKTRPTTTEMETEATSSTEEHENSRTVKPILPSEEPIKSNGTIGDHPFVDEECKGLGSTFSKVT